MQSASSDDESSRMEVYMGDLLNRGTDDPEDLARLRRAQFAQVNASLSLEGMEADSQDLKMQESVATGEMSHDDAVALYVKKARLGAS